MTQDRLRLVLADDHRLVVEALRRVLQDSFDLVGVVADGNALLAEIVRLRPDIVVTDISMPRMNGVEAIREIQLLDDPPGIIVLSMHAEPRLVREALQAGARGYVLKEAAGTELVKAVCEVHAGRRYVTPLVQTFEPPPVEHIIENHRSGLHLTPRQCQVLELTARGYRMKQVATVLHISRRTVESHKYQLMETLGAHSTADLVVHAIRLGLIELGDVRSARVPAGTSPD